MERGYVKLWRSIDQNELLENDNTAFIVFMKLLTRVDRNTGTFKTGRKKFANICNLNPNTLYSALKRLEASTIIQQQSNKSSTTIYLCNWWKYQQDVNNSSSHRQSTVNTKQEKKEKENISTNVDKSNSKELDAAHEWICKLFDKNPNRFKLTTQRKQKLKLRLKELGKERFKLAFEAIAASNWHRGDNDRGWKIDDDPYWLLTSAEKAEKWANKYEEVERASAPINLSEVEVKG